MRPTITGVERWTVELLPRLHALAPDRYVTRRTAAPRATAAAPARPGSRWCCRCRPGASAPA